jgi:hypothetical protein
MFKAKGNFKEKKKMKEYTIISDLRDIFNMIEEIKVKIDSLEDKVKRAKLYPQLLSNEIWCETPKGEENARVRKM